MSRAIDALARVAGQRFHSFSEAVEAVLDVLGQVLPPGKVFLGQLDHDEGVYRIVDARGNTVAGLDRGTTLSVPESAVPDPESLRELSVKSFVAVPLEASDGRRVGSLCALGTASGLYTREHLELLTVLGRLLAHEWEIVNARAELRRLGDQLKDRDGTHPVSGLPNRARFVESVEREWSLVQRGTLESYLVVCRVDGLDAAREQFGEAMGDLLLKDVAEVLTGALRRTDHHGQVGEDLLGAVLVGCKGEEGAEAFASRFLTVLGRVIAPRPAGVEPAFGIRALSDAASAEEVLEATEEDARGASARPVGDVAEVE